MTMKLSREELAVPMDFSYGNPANCVNNNGRGPRHRTA